MSFFRPDVGTGIVQNDVMNNDNHKEKKNKKGNIPRSSFNPLVKPPTIHSYHSSTAATTTA